MKNDDDFKAFEDALNVANESLNLAKKKMPFIKTFDQAITSDINAMLRVFESGNGEMIEDITKKILAKNQQRLKDLDDANNI